MASLSASVDNRSASVRALSAGIVALGLCWAAVPAAWAAPQALSAQDVCRRVDVAADGASPLVGIEDIEIDLAADAVFLSAYDRDAVDAAVDADATVVPDGGVYRLAFTELNALARNGADANVPTLRARSLTSGLDLAHGLRPHGMGLLRPADTEGPAIGLAAVNHGYRRVDGEWVAIARIETFDLSPSGLVHRSTLPSADALSDETLLCNLNDVLPLGPDHGLATADRRWCDGFWRGSETAMGLERAAVLAYGQPPGPGIRVLVDGLYFANGVTALGSGTEQMVAVAETRGHRLSLFRLDRLGELEPAGQFDLDVAPDNLTISRPPDGTAADQSLWLAGFPDLLEVGMYRAGLPGFEHASWEAWRIDGASLFAGEGDAWPVLTGDGSLLSAVTVAAVADGLLLAGSATDRGLLVCDLPAGLH